MFITKGIAQLSMLVDLNKKNTPNTKNTYLVFHHKDKKVGEINSEPLTSKQASNKFFEAMKAVNEGSIQIEEL